ncbi:MAG: hypothetical protein KAT68_17335 [Bacteroidales bacterium]|nr:hypothetical protein [Bacteroidales bacterium]
MKKYCRNCKYYKSYYWWDIFRIFWKPIICFPDRDKYFVYDTPECKIQNKNNDCEYYEKRWWYLWVK